MERVPSAFSFQANNKGPSFGKVIFEIYPFALKRKRDKTRFLEIPLHGSSGDALLLPRIESLLDNAWVRPRKKRRVPALISVPVLHHHGDGSGAAAIFLLLDEWNVQPNPGWAVCSR